MADEVQKKLRAFANTRSSYPAAGSAIAARRQNQQPAQQSVQPIPQAAGVGEGDAAASRAALTGVNQMSEIVAKIIGGTIAGGGSVRNASKYAQRAMEAYWNATDPGAQTSGTRLSPRTFSASKAYQGGLKANFQEELNSSTNSFFKNGNQWWQRSMESRGQSADRAPWSAANDPGLGAAPGKGYNFQNDPGLGYASGQTPALAQGYSDQQFSDFARMHFDDMQSAGAGQPLLMAASEKALASFASTGDWLKQTEEFGD